jgi:lipoprotein-releasing system permease protein
MYKRFLSRRYLRKRRIVYLPIVAVALCSFMVLIVVSVMGGFLDNIRSRSFGLLGHMVMDNGTWQGFPHYQEFIDLIKEKPELKIEEATPILYMPGLLRITLAHGDRDVPFTKAVQVVGIDLDEKIRTTDFGKGLFYNNHFPGRVSLQGAKQPLWGIDFERQQIQLPAEWEEAFTKQPKNFDPSTGASLWPRHNRPMSDWPGPGAFDFTDDHLLRPGYLNDDPAELPGMIIGLDFHNVALASRDKKGNYARFLPQGYKVLLTLLPLPMSEDGTLAPSGLNAVSRTFRYVDDSRTGVYDIDERTAYVDLNELQKLTEMNEVTDPETGQVYHARCSQIQIKLKDVDKNDIDQISAIGKAIQSEWDEFASRSNDRFMEIVAVQTWEETQRKFISAVEKEKQLMVLLFAIISGVAIVLVFAVFYMIVVEKTRDIGIIKSMGASALGVAAIFLRFGVGVGLAGSIVGVIGGYCFTRRINEIHDWLADSLGWIMWSREVYVFDRIPDQVKGSDVVWIVVAAIVASIFGALIPAIRAARQRPVEAVRFE